MRCAIVVAAVAIAAALPASASAYSLGGYAWPGQTIRYHASAARYSTAVDRAARIWNRQKLGVRFARSSRASADVLVIYGGPRCGGLSPMGYGGRRAGQTLVRLGAGCDTGLITLTAIHEFGHVLGLDHEYSKCARMNPSLTRSGTPTRCGGHSLSYWLANPLEDDDVLGARALYSGNEGEPEEDPRERPWHPHDDWH